MALNLAHMLSRSVLQAAPAELPRARPKLFRKGDSDAVDAAPDDGELADLCAETARRTRIWEFDGSLHCSIIGTCLTTAELRHLLDKLKLTGVAATEHDLHALGVRLAG